MSKTYEWKFGFYRKLHTVEQLTFTHRYDDSSTDGKLQRIVVQQHVRVEHIDIYVQKKIPRYSVVASPSHKLNGGRNARPHTLSHTHTRTHKHAYT